MYRTWVISKHTFYEVIGQPIFLLLLAIGSAILGIYGALPFFTFGEDTVMFKAVGLDVVLLLVLIIVLFSTSKSVFEEIEDRTMLTLMSKPVRRWQVILGKYLGIVSAGLLAILALGGVLMLATWWRIPLDYQIRPTTLDDAELRRLYELRLMHLTGLGVAVLVAWMQISVLASIGVALSTRFPLVVNLPVVILIYIGGNLTQFLFPLDQASWLMTAVAQVLGTVLPYLGLFDMRSLALHSTLAVPGTRFVDVSGAVSLGGLFASTGLAFLYACIYSTFALAAGLWLFTGRELGGNEG